MTNDQNDGGSLAVYTISAHLPFVDTLAAGIRDLTENDPAQLTAVRVLLPTRRACRSLRDAFLRLSHGQPTLLPQMTPIGDVDEDELLLSGTGDDMAGVDPLDIPPAVSPLRRQLLLARLIMARGDTSADQAVRLGLELARLLDQLHTERLDFSKFATLVPDTYSQHWQETLQFLEILTREWPAILASDGAIDAADRRNRLLDSQTRQWRRHPPTGPIIAAGSTGSIPATADLLATIAGLPAGRVVVPGLDRALSDEAWQELEPHHPQFGLSRLLAHFGLTRHQVQDWSSPAATEANRERLALVSRALAPANVAVSPPRPLPQTAMAKMSLANCPTAREEAGVIALAMRETLEQPEKTVALITPDRALARRVASELLRWQIEVDDSAGQPLIQSAPGSFFRLTARMVSERYAPVALLAALKHPLAAGGMARARFRNRVRQLEISLLRGPRPAPGLDGLRQALAEADTAAEPVSDVLAILDQASQQMEALTGSPSMGLSDLVRAHVDLVEQLAGNGSEDGARQIWAGEAGEALAGFVAELIEHSAVMSDLTLATYPAFLDGLMSGRAVRPHFGRHPRVFIWGLMEARLQRTDLVILGGLNEGTWPPQTDAGPWLSRPMMAGLGLSQPERQIGLTAHDFVQAFCAPNVLMTRAERVDGTPTVASRWLMRLDNSLKGSGIAEGLPENHTYSDWFDALDRPDRVTPIQPPAPRPPVAARPRGLSVTAIETWIRDPYSIFARQILRLRPLEPLDANPGAADRGSLIHEILEDFMNTYPRELPDNAEDCLIEIGELYFQSHLSRPGVRAFWWPRFLRIASWFVAYEKAQRLAGIHSVLIEQTGNMKIDVGDTSFNLRAKADRMDRLTDGSLAVIDYKTGQPPTAPQVESWLVPQLSLEAAMAAAGAFPDLAPAPVSALIYLRLSGGRIAGEVKRLKLDVDEVAQTAVQRLRGYIASFSKAETPYRSRPRPMFKSRFSDYDHLARVREWSSIDGEDGS
ncbi:MAG: double-strand break repair protein AddB [Rhodospirillales bacterium]|nr:double-strand break repair protein AddB [Rhodospirillales bacterium]